MGNSKHTIKGFPLVRFKSKGRIESFRHGEIYFNTLKWYREHEENNVVDDLFEGMVHINEATAITTPINGGETQIEKLDDVLLKTTHSNDFVSCMFSVSPKNDFFQFDEKQKIELKKFGDTALLITDADEFLRRIAIAVDREKLKGLYGFVQYYDEKVDLINIWISLMKNMGNISYWKRKSYSYQQEFRISIFNDSSDENMILNIGDICDISEVYDTAQILNSMIFEHKAEEKQ